MTDLSPKPEGPRKGPEGPEPSRVPLPATPPGAAFLASLFRPHAWLIAAIALALLLEAALAMAYPLGFRHLIDHALLARDRGVLAGSMAVLAGAALALSLVGLGRDYMLARLGARAFVNARARMFDRLLSLGAAFHARTSAASILARFGVDLATIEQAFAAAVPWAVLPAIEATLGTAVLFTLSVPLALLALLAWPICLLGPRVFSGAATHAATERRAQESQVLGVVNESIGNREVVRAYGLEGAMAAQFAGSLEAFRRIGVRTGFLFALVERSAGVGVLALQVIVLGAGTWLAFEGRISLGTLAAFQAIFLSVCYSLGYMTQYLPSLLQATAGLRRIEELLMESPEVADRPDAVALPPTTGGRAIAFEGVGFDYAGGGGLAEVSFAVAPGERVAVVGASGAGKSTLFRLLLRFYDPQRGRVTVDGHDLRDLTQASWRSAIGVVFQEAPLFDVSVAANIEAGRAGASFEQVRGAAEAAEVHGAILGLPEGYATRVGERGERLSGGQRQRLAIARALLRDPSVLLLDEATSALDAPARAAILGTLERAGRGRTMIVVTHDLETAARMDRILVFEAGRLVEDGPHAQLLALGGAYARLWEGQRLTGPRCAPEAG